MQRYIVRIVSAAVTESGKRKVITVPAASVIDVSSPMDGLLGVTLSGQTMLRFAEDLIERGDPVRAISVSKLS